MKAKSLLFIGFVALVALASCGKDKLETTPALEFKSINLSDMRQRDLLEIIFDFRDKEGDIDSAFVEVTIINEALVGSPDAEPFELRNKVPEFPGNKTGELAIRGTRFDNGEPVPAGYVNLIPISSSNDNDTVRISLQIKDKKGNTSEKITVPENVVVIKQ